MQFACFSNFSSNTLVVDGTSYPTVEHFFQASKFAAGDAHRNKILAAATPAVAKKLGKTKKISKDEWYARRNNVMETAIRAKFEQNDAARACLLGTGERELVEHTARDKYWGDGGGTGRGQNMLGKILMKVRGELAEKGTKKGDDVKKKHRATTKEVSVGIKKS